MSISRAKGLINVSWWRF